jgi:DNA replication protein DnaC
MNAAEVIDLLRTLRLDGMAASFEHQAGNRAFDDLSREEFVGNLCLAERQRKADRTQIALKRRANFRHIAEPEDIIWDASRGLDKSKVRELLNGDWVKRKENLLLSGAAGTGKTWLGCAIGHGAIRAGMMVRYFRTNLLLEEIRKAHADRSIAKIRKSLATPSLLILDDFGIAPIPEASKEDLFELLEARCDNNSTMIIGQLAPVEWHSFLDTSHMADAMMDRIVQRSHSINLKGDSLRKRL